MAKINITNQSTASMPNTSSGKSAIFVDDVSKKVCVKDDTQAVSTIASEAYVTSMFSALWVPTTAVFWDGSDWDVTISADTTLTRDMYYNNLTINTTKKLYPNGYRIYVKGTLLNNGTISQNWNNGVNGSWASSLLAGSAWWAAVNAWTLNAWVAWGNGWNCVNVYGWGTYVWPTVPSTKILTYSNNNWANGWTSSSSQTWTWWTSIRWILYNKLYDFNTMLFLMSWMASYAPVQYKVAASASWWGWTNINSSNVYSMWTWGWWGSSGWLIWIAANTYNNAWVVTATWWNGWTAINTTYSAWGWGGWHWWIVFLVYKTLTALWTNTLTWGTWGVASWAWATNGSNGSDWSVIQITVV